MTTTTTTTATTDVASLTDEHSVLLWQACAYADDLTEAARSRRRLSPSFDAMLGFVHYRLLPYLAAEERELESSGLRDEHLAPMLFADHDRIRADVENVESSRTRRLLALATETLVTRLDHHVRREENWVSGPDSRPGPWSGDRDHSPFPLLLTDVVDLDALPADERTVRVLARLQQMARGQSLRLRSSSDLHSLWRRQHAVSPGSHAWVYEHDGPEVWIARVTRRLAEGE